MHNIEPSSILVITFTKAAAISMKQRFLSLVGDSYVSVTFGTFHAVFFNMLRQAYNYSAGSIITADTQYSFIRECRLSALSWNIRMSRRWYHLLYQR